MNIRILRVDLKETNAQLRRIADALERAIPIPRVRPLGPSDKKIQPQDIGSYLDEDDTPSLMADKLRAAGANDREIEKAISEIFDLEDEAQ